MLDWDLEDWLTDEGDKVVRKAAAANSESVLGLTERLLYEVWLFDTAQRNGGVSQYFCNYGLPRWDLLSNLAEGTLPSFSEFAAKINEVVGRSSDPYQAVLDSDFDLDAWYDDHQTQLVVELQSAVRPPDGPGSSPNL